MSEPKDERPDVAEEPDVTFTPDRDDPRSLDDVHKEDLPRLKADGEPNPLRDAAGVAVHGETVWGGPRFIHNASGEPVWVDTKEQYWALLRANGLRMKDQQESSTGADDGPPAELIVPVHLQPPPPVEPITQHEAHIYGAMSGVLRRYGLIETLWCDHCFARRKWHGCKFIVSDMIVAIQCHCGIGVYKPPVGTTDLFLKTVANAAITLADRTMGTIMTEAAGQQMLPAHLLVPQEALIIRSHLEALRARGKEPRWHHQGCWGGDARREVDACAMKITPHEIIVICQCRQLFERQGTGSVN